MDEVIDAVAFDFDCTSYIRSMLNWESKVKSSISFLAFLLGVWFFQPWMLTFSLLIPFLQERDRTLIMILFSKLVFSEILE